MGTERMDKQELTKIGEGFYVGEKGLVYFDMAEFIAFHNLPNDKQTRMAVYEEIRRAFYPDVVRRLDE